MLIEERFAAALEGNPAISGLLFSRRLSAKRLAELRRRRFPVVFNQHGGPRSALLTAASGARGACGLEGIPVRLRLQRARSGRRGILRKSHRAYRRAPHIAILLDGLAARADSAAQVFPQPAAVDRVRRDSRRSTELLPGHRTRYCSQEARMPTMRWPAEKFAEIARWLREKHGIVSVVNLAAAR